MVIPQLSTEQLESVRTIIAEARRIRAQLKNQVESDALTLPQALDRAAGDKVLSCAKVMDPLRALPCVGVTRFQGIMESLDITSNRRICNLDRHQIDRLRELFSQPVPRIPWGPCQDGVV